jgi:hypothetical protein
VISWRYHLVSIVAVFLALGLGVLAGTTVLDQGLVNTLQDRTQRLQDDLGELRATVGDLQDRLGAMSAFADQALPHLVESQLSDREIVIVTQDGVEDGSVDQAREALDLAGAVVLTTLSVRPEMAAETAESRRALAELLGMPESTPPEDLSATAADLLATRLSLEPDPIAEPGSEDLLGVLLSEGFVTASTPGLSDATLLDLGGRDQVVVTVGGGSEEIAPGPSSFLVPLVRSLADSGVVTAAGESLSVEVSYVERVRDEVDADGTPLVTVDDLDQAVGGAALVLGLQRASLEGIGGHYGVKAGASRLLPAAG